MKKSLVVLALAMSIGSIAQAADAPAVTANVSLTTNYKYRGQDQGSNQPALQGGFDYAPGNGFYVGNWNSSIGFTNAGLEMDFYAGYKGEAAGIGYDVGVLQYYYPQKNKIINFDTTEIYGAVSYSIATLKYSYTVSKDYFGFADVVNLLTASSIKGTGTGYLDLSANYEVAKGVTLNGHVGFTQLASDLKNAGYVNFADYKLGATYDLGSGFSIAGAIVGATKKDFYGDPNKGRLILTLTKSM